MISILRAPASMLFSMSSFTTEAGRSTTSPAATWLATASGNNRIRLISIANCRFPITDCEIKGGGMGLATPLTWPGRKLVLKLDMINVTQNAARQLRALLEQQSHPAGKGLRVQVAKGGCSGLHYEMSLDEKRAGDNVVQHDGVEFFIDS